MDRDYNMETYTLNNKPYEQMKQIMEGLYSREEILNFLLENDDSLLSEEVLLEYRRAVLDSGIYLLHTDKFDKPVIDIVGPGGDGKLTANISTFASLICAATKLVCVAKYGNKSASGICGSMDIFEELGIKIQLNVEEVTNQLQRINIAPLYAQFIYPGGKFVAEARRLIGTPTIFNLLFSSSRPLKGKLHFVFGCASKNQMVIIEKLYKSDPGTRCLIVNGHDGTDEISVSDNGKTNYALLDKGKIKRGVIDCYELFNICPKELSLLCVNSKNEAVKLFRDALDPMKSCKKIDALRNAGIVNAGVALFIALENNNPDLRKANEYITIARNILSSGKVLQLVNELKLISVPHEFLK